MAIPAFQKVRQNSRRGALINDARQIGAAVQQYMMEASVTTVSISYTPSSGAVGSPLTDYVKQIGTNYGLANSVTAEGTFTISHPLVKGGFDGKGNLGTAVTFNAEGQLYSGN
jgi:hypothetical protein